MVKINNELNNLYDKVSTICYHCVQVKNNKYHANTLIPCISFSLSQSDK